METKKKIRVYIGGVVKLPNIDVSLKNLIDKIKTSNLATAAKIIIVHSPDWNYLDHSFLQSSGLDIEYFDSKQRKGAFEYPGLRKLWKDAQDSSFYGLYLHTKGASKTDATELENALKWADLMMRGLIDHSDDCVKHLESGADIVGCMWYWHFKGNFFWFDSAYAKKLPDPCNSKLDLSNRFHAEYWISYSFFFENYEIPYPRVKNLFYPNDVIEDTQFINSNYVVNLEEKKVCENFTDFINIKYYPIFDKIIVTYHEFVVYKELLKKYLNYDGTVEIKEQNSQRNFESISIY